MKTLYLFLVLLCSSQVHAARIIPSSADCAYAIEPLTKALQTVAFPAGHVFLIACDDKVWTELQHRIPNLKHTNHAGTSRSEHKTIIRGEMFRRDIDGFNFMHILRHEAWHMKLDTDEEKPVIAATASEEAAL